MRIQPCMNRFSKINRAQTQFERKNNFVPKAKQPHNYSGIASVDLAYASMIDMSIAKDLRLMGLI